MKKSVLILFALFVWLVGSNHCAFEQITNSHSSNFCPCNEQQSQNDRCHGESPQLASTPSDREILYSIEALDLHNLLAVITNLDLLTEISSANNTVILLKHHKSLIFALVHAPNAPPV